jgi:hemerythrin-like domain-containing protein
MSFNNRVCQTLHEEHEAALALMQRLEQLIARHRRGGPPDVADAAVAKLLSDLSTGVEREFQRHFSFEEDELFPYLRANGEEALGAHLTDEHAVIRPIGTRLATVARGAMTAGFDEATWEEFCRLGQELSGIMHGHVQKEEMALLPLIEDSMDADTEARLVEEYLETA